MLEYYDPQYTVKKNVREYVSSIIKDHVIVDSSIEMIITFYFEMPKSWSKKKRKEMDGLKHIQRPDTTNLIKFYEDAFNEFIFVDDCQISDITAKKRWSQESKTAIEIK